MSHTGIRSRSDITKHPIHLMDRIAFAFDVVLHTLYLKPSFSAQNLSIIKSVKENRFSSWKNKWVDETTNYVVRPTKYEVFPWKIKPMTKPGILQKPARMSTTQELRMKKFGIVLRVWNRYNKATIIPLVVQVPMKIRNIRISLIPCSSPSILWTWNARVYQSVSL